MSHSGRKELKPVVRFFHELRRRRVIRVAIAYLVGAWVLIEVSSVLLPAMGFSDTAVSVVVWLAVVGLPVALLLAWIFDLTPEGIVRSDRAPVASAEAEEHSLAVLAFADRSEEKNQEYLAEGISEELINILGRIQGLSIAARSSAFKFKGEDRDVREAGRQLKVAAVLDGAVRASDEKLRISAELIDVGSGYSLWSNTYDRAADEVFKIQDDISHCIVRELKPALTSKYSDAPLVDPGTQNLEAYSTYLKGRYYWNSRYAVGLERGIEYFTRAVSLDSEFALPWSGLADSFSLLAFYNVLPPKSGFQQARDAAVKAVELGPDLAETHASAALIRTFFDWNFPSAEAAYRKSLEFNPNYGPARFWYAFMLAAQGRVDDSLKQIDKAREAEPFSAIINGGASYLDYFLRRHDAGITDAEEVLAADPNFGPANMFLGFHYLAAGDPQKGAEYWRQAVEREERLVLARLMLGCALARCGNCDAAREVRSGVEAIETPYVSSYFMAALDLALGEPDTALDRLEAALEERNNFLTLMGMDPLFDQLRDEPRFLAILAKVGVPLQRT